MAQHDEVMDGYKVVDEGEAQFYRGIYKTYSVLRALAARKVWEEDSAL